MYLRYTTDYHNAKAKNKSADLDCRQRADLGSSANSGVEKIWSSRPFLGSDKEPQWKWSNDACTEVVHRAADGNVG